MRSSLSSAQSARAETRRTREPPRARRRHEQRPSRTILCARRASFSSSVSHPDDHAPNGVNAGCQVFPVVHTLRTVFHVFAYRVRNVVCIRLRSQTKLVFGRACLTIAPDLIRKVSGAARLMADRSTILAFVYCSANLAQRQNNRQWMNTVLKRCRGSDLIVCSGLRC